MDNRLGGRAVLTSFEDMTDRVVIDGCALTVYEDGDGDVPVVFISGLGGSGEEWTSVVKHLETSVAGLAFDRPGIGGSDSLKRSQPRSARWMAERVGELMDGVGIVRPAVVVGHSIGAQIADALAVVSPSRVAGLVLVDGSDPSLNLDLSSDRRYLDDGDDSGRQGWRWDVAASAREFRASPPTRRPPTVVVASAIWRWFDVEDPSRYAPFTLTELDQRWQRTQLEYALRWGGELVVAHEAGHNVQRDAPGLVATAVDAVVSAVASGSSVALPPDRLHRSGGTVRPTFYRP